MKTLNDMLQKATQLSKREMKNVKGGEDTYCGSGCSGRCEYNGRAGTCTFRKGECGCLVKKASLTEYEEY